MSRILTAKKTQVVHVQIQEKKMQGKEIMWVVLFAYVVGIPHKD